jgi:hypothetical protein
VTLLGHESSTPAPAASPASAPASVPAARVEEKPTPVTVSENEDFDDMFGDEELNEDGESAEEAAATKARQERMALALKLKEEKDAKEGKVKKEKEKPVEKSLVVLEVQQKNSQSISNRQH